MAVDVTAETSCPRSCVRRTIHGSADKHTRVQNNASGGHARSE
jgi:hypothetical protein